MFNWLQLLNETQRAILTVVVFVATFLVALMIGRLLKRRARVQLGLFFRLFCLALAFYMAMWVAGVSIDIRNHVGAVLLLLSTAIVVALLNRYLWDLYFEEKRQTRVPHFPRQLVALLIFLVALLLVLWYGYHAGRWLTGLLAGSGVVAIILGLAGQNLLGGIIAGVSLQINRPYNVGDWLQVGDRYAEVMEINWRSTRLRTNDTIYLDIPNNEIVKQTIVNLHYPTEVHAMRVRVGLEYHVPPNLAKDVLAHAAQTANGVLPHPPVRVFLVDFADFAMIYEIKFYMGNHARINEINDAVRTNMWYALKRHGLTVPFPIRTLHVRRHAARPMEDEKAEAREILRAEPIFECLSDTQLDNLVQQAHLNHFGRGERVIEEGAEGDSMFVLLRGMASVLVAKNGARIQVATLGAGDCFGEMSLLTGEKRSATVRADADCYVMEIGKPIMAGVIRDAPGCLEQLSDLLAKRRLETEGVLKEAASQELTETKQREYRANFMGRLRSFLEL
jgi:small-conductance mechanosensitive channel